MAMKSSNSSAEGQLSRKQLSVFWSIARNRVKKKLSNIHGAGNVTDEMINQALIEQQTRDLEQFLPRGKSKYAEATPLNYLAQETPTEFSEQTPLKKHVEWLTLAQQDKNATVCLTEEIELFAQYVGLTQEELAVRDLLIEDLSEAIASRWSSASVVIFGSFAAGLSIFQSDIDLAVLCTELETSSSSSTSPSPLVSILNPQLAHMPAAKRQRLSSRVEAQSLQGKQVLFENPNPVTVEMEVAEKQSEVLHEQQLQPGSLEEEDWLLEGLVTMITRSLPGHFFDHEEDDEDNQQNGHEIENTDRVQDEGSSLSFSHGSQKGGSYGNGEVRRKRKRLVLDDQYDDDGSQTSEENEAIDLEEEEGEEEEEEEKMAVDWIEDRQGEQSLPEEVLEMRRDNDVKEMVTSGLELGLTSPSLLLQQEQEQGQDNLLLLPSASYSSLRLMSHEERQEEQLQRRRVLVHGLKRLAGQMVAFDWITKLELRKRAKVPIIHLAHRCRGLEADVALGLDRDDTLLTVQGLISISSGLRVLFPLAAVLKVFLGQLGLDKPFHGGLGSFKLYVLLARHCQANPELLGILPDPDDHRNTNSNSNSNHSTNARNNPNLGSLLLTFLKTYGQPANLSTRTVVDLSDLPGLEGNRPVVSFVSNLLAHQVQRAFKDAYQCLARHLKSRLTGPVHQNSKNSHQVSSSCLGRLFDAARLAAVRKASQAAAVSFLQERGSPLEQEQRAQVILKELQERLAAKTNGPVLQLDLAQLPRGLKARLMACSSLSRAFQRQGYRNGDREEYEDEYSGEGSNRGQKKEGIKRSRPPLQDPHIAIKDNGKQRKAGPRNPNHPNLKMAVLEKIAIKRGRR